MNFEERPWGAYEVLADHPAYKVKRIEVKPGGRLSYQYHHKRSEVWTIIYGVATVTLEGVEQDFNVGQVVQIPVLAKHRVQNNGSETLVFVEVQHGEYFGEDDIVRIEDDYQRN